MVVRIVAGLKRRDLRTSPCESPCRPLKHTDSAAVKGSAKLWRTSAAGGRELLAQKIRHRCTTLAGWDCPSRCASLYDPRLPCTASAIRTPDNGAPSVDRFCLRCWSPIQEHPASSWAPLLVRSEFPQASRWVLRCNSMSKYSNSNSTCFGLLLFGGSQLGPPAGVRATRSSGLSQGHSLEDGR